MQIKRALISVSNKEGIIDFAKKLTQMGVEIISTGGTLKLLKENEIHAVAVQEVTGFPEMMDGRVKTLHPKIHGGILALRNSDKHLNAMKVHNINSIDLVVVNLYPFSNTISKKAVTLEEAIENIDIGGPSMVRSAAKNFKFVTVIVNPNKYSEILEKLAEKGKLSLEERMHLAQEAFAHTAMYDSIIANYLEKQLQGEKTFSEFFNEVFFKKQNLRYGENPHQKAAFYEDVNSKSGIGHAEQLHGKELSYNNIVDMEAAWQIVSEFKEKPAATIIKHTNPCGTALGETILEAYEKAFAADSVSAFGGIVALNSKVTVALAEKLEKIFFECILAPSYEPAALEILKEKKNLRLLIIKNSESKFNVLKRVSGGLLVQENDDLEEQREMFEVVTKRQPTEEEWQELLFAWKVVKHVKSNAIVLSKDKQTIGIGAGQMNRVGAAKIALEEAGDKVADAVMASDAFLPFRDTVDAAAQVGIKAIIQPGGSIRDEESIQAADENNMTMIFTKIRHFKH